MSAPIAVVGMDCRVPGAGDLAAFWRLLLDGATAAGPVPFDRWTPEPELPATVTPAGFLTGADAFDHRFFGLSPHEAAAMDPQQRLLLQASWRALEDAGIAPRSLAGTQTSVHVGMMSSEWGTLHLADHRTMTAHRGSGNGYCMAANRISYHLDLRGPSMAVDTACSSSLVAVHLAATALRAGEVDVAIAAGVNLILTPALSMFYAEAGLAAPDGRCKPFADAADGIGRGEGIGVVVLSRLEDAVRDGRPVYAVIDSGAVGSDGRSNGLTAPNRFAQAEVVRTAYARAGLDPAEVHLVEGHGTGTRLGDMIEVRALGDVHRGRERPALLGSVKANVGHLEGAAGITGLIKTCLALHHRLLPGSPGGVENPELRLADHGLRLAGTARRLPAGTVHAGVSSFGLGGTNAHLLLSSAPRPRLRSSPCRDAVVLVTGAATQAGLHTNLGALREAVAAEPAATVGQLAWSTTVVKTGHRHRAAIAGTPAELLPALDAALAAIPAAAKPSPRPKAPRVALVFTGQGSQYPGMTSPLYRHCPPYRRHLEAVSAALGSLAGGTVLDLLLGEGDLQPSALTQSALFAVEYALAATLRELGVQPVLLVGHSVGEIAAACIGGALTLNDAARLVVARGGLMQQLPPGGVMLSVRAAESKIRDVLGADLGAAAGEVLDVAAHNGPQATVLSGDADAVARAAAALADARVATARLPVSHAFHSRLVAPAVAPLASLAAGLPPRPLTIPLASTVRGTLLPAGSVLEAGHWSEQVSGPVRFAEAALHLAAVAPTHVVEVGPRPVLLALLREGGYGSHRGLVCCSGPAATGSELAGVLAALHADGCDLRWERWYEAAQQRLRRVPGHVFDTDTRSWIERPSAAATTPVAPAPVAFTAPAARMPAELPPTATGGGVLAGAVLAAISTVSGHAVEALAPHAQLDADLGFDSVMAMRLADELSPHLGGPDRLDAEAFLLPHLTTVGGLITHLEGTAARLAQDGALR
jgi:acyl transferase domain-containing protein